MPHYAFAVSYAHRFQWRQPFKQTSTDSFRYHSIPFDTTCVPHVTSLKDISIVDCCTIVWDDGSNPILSIIFNVEPRNGHSGWQVRKPYVDVMATYATVSGRLRRGFLPSLPSPKGWLNLSPTRLDARRHRLQNCLQALLHFAPSDLQYPLGHWISSDVPIERPTHMSGYLTKQGRTLGMWTSRFYVLGDGGLLVYDSPGGSLLRRIRIEGSELRVQRHSRPADEFRHAIMIAEPAPHSAHGRLRKTSTAHHILCASSESEKQAWLMALQTKSSRANG
ncbi:hypothetical protein FISHEDRAFT_56532 [Fistulina hepatica ATCC 64428]|uniref:PH domain-containing protein n=1 Tax=Fistulina hepatica ATCC 64428 TaxID=1128425 RepID=A0A0D7AIN3_9AGAR|nr:hypothetical protein FISHEDRAFT_56532 [Fistulina hepatica ATCC 64428]